MQQTLYTIAFCSVVVALATIAFTVIVPLTGTIGFAQVLGTTSGVLAWAATLFTTAFGFAAVLEKLDEHK